MQVVVIAEQDLQDEFISKKVPADVEIIFKKSIEAVEKSADTFFYLLNEEKFSTDQSIIKTVNKPFFVNSVIISTEQMPGNCIRVNGWPGFFQRSILEISAGKNQRKAVEILEQFGWNFQLVPDIPGMITARTIAMIINEAYFALGDNVSSKEDINIAMKLGTNYPFGPFEWAEKIGLEKVYKLLKQLSKEDSRYIPAPLLIKETVL